MATRIGVDVGGTFTDLIFYDDESGEVRVAKEPTTPSSPEEGVVRAVEAAVPQHRIGSTRYFLHGTTVGLNALLERRGAVVGMLSTRGFRDVLEIRRGDRDEMYNLFWAPPPPLVPRRRRLPVTERIRADGTIHTPLDPEDIRKAVGVFQAEEVACVAVAFINSYANPEHELAAERALREFGFEGEISLSHQVSGEYREYERTTTTVVDAYVRPTMTAYLRRLEESLASIGLNGNLLVTRCGGGSMMFSEAEERPFETVQSGPVAGAEGAAELARKLRLGDVITADVGGTSFDTALIQDGRPAVLFEGKVVGLPIQTSWVDVRSIGAGGGSIAYVDVGGLLRVGPQSAGADPGPACYAKGGTLPTVTDSAFVLGMLGEGKLAGGVSLDGDAARAALAPLGEGLGFEVEEVARGVMTITAANMANAIREITIERGQDPRRATLMAFGGAGPLFGTLLARELDVAEIVVPPYAGNFSAWGLLGSDLTRTAARTRIQKLSSESVEDANALLADLFAGLESRANGSSGETTREVGLDMRYAGQEHTLTVAVPSSDGAISVPAEEVHELFTSDYARTFALTMEEEVEIVSARATLRTALPRRAEDRAAAASSNGGSSATVDAYSFTHGDWLPFEILKRDGLEAGTQIEGPAIVLEETATTYVDADYVGRIDESACLFVRKVG